MPEGPQGFQRRQASTQFLQVPVRDWTAIKGGFKTEFRNRFGVEARNVQYHKIKLPTPVVAYSTRRSPAQHEWMVMVLDEYWTEPLGAISEESIQREGFETLAHFRRYWTDRTKLRFRPMEKVQVFRVHKYTEDEREALGAILFDRLFGDFTGASTESDIFSRRSSLPTGLR